MNEKTAGHEHTGLGAELKVLLREPPLLISILAVFLLFAVFIIYPFAKILLVPTAADWMRAITGKEFIQVFGNTIFSSLIATATAIVFGFLFAYGINYTNMPCKRFFQVVALLPTMAPSVRGHFALCCRRKWRHSQHEETSISDCRRADMS